MGDEWITLEPTAMLPSQPNRSDIIAASRIEGAMETNASTDIFSDPTAYFEQLGRRIAGIRKRSPLLYRVLVVLIYLVLRVVVVLIWVAAISYLFFCAVVGSITIVMGIVVLCNHRRWAGDSEMGLAGIVMVVGGIILSVVSWRIGVIPCWQSLRTAVKGK